MADNVIALSNGRLILGLGAGDFTSEHQAYGFDFERHVSRFEEALQIVLPLLKGERFSYTGQLHRVRGCRTAAALRGRDAADFDRHLKGQAADVTPRCAICRYVELHDRV